MSTANDPAAPEHESEEPQRAGFVELLFDVVFVFGLNRMSGRLGENFTWQGIYLSVVLFLALWWVWYRTAWITNRYSPKRPAIQCLVIVTMFGTLLMGAALPGAEGQRGTVFAIVFVALGVPRALWLVLLGGNRKNQLISARTAFWSAIAAIPWIISIPVTGTALLAWWTLAIGLNYLGGVLDYPTPKLGRAGLRGQPIAAEHLTERYRQILIIAFGETILTSGLNFNQFGLDKTRTLALVASFLATVLMWQIYTYRAGELLLTAILSSRTPAHLSSLAAYAHLIMMGGLLATAVSDTIILEHPLVDARLDWVLVTLTGPGLFLIGRAMLDHIAFRHVSWSRPIGLLALAALGSVTIGLPMLVVATVPVLVLAGIAIANGISWRLFPREPTPPVDR